MSRATKQQRQAHAFAIDEELRMQDEIEDMLEHEVRYLWRRTRELGLAGHDGWRDVFDPYTSTWFNTGCDCNSWNREQLKAAIRRLRTWREHRSYCV